MTITYTFAWWHLLYALASLTVATLISAFYDERDRMAMFVLAALLWPLWPPMFVAFWITDRFEQWRTK